MPRRKAPWSDSESRRRAASRLYKELERRHGAELPAGVWSYLVLAWDAGYARAMRKRIELSSDTR
jgi:hypothetical protein